MNILYLHSHDTGRYIGAYGYPAPTPEIDSFASGAALFRNAHSIAPTCSPSRAGLLTGAYPHEVGMLGLAHRGFRLDDYSLHLAGHLRENGYTTTLCGVQHIAPRKSLIGYDRILDGEKDYFDLEITDLAAYDRTNAERVAEYLSDPPQGPFFLSFGLLNTHRPFPEPPPSSSHTSRAHTSRPPSPIPDTPETRADTEGFHRSLHIADECIGRVLDALAHSGVEEETLVLLTTDHGPAFPEMKATLRDDGTGVMLMMRVPGQGLRGNGGTVDTIVSQLDLFPTICELAGIELPRKSRDRYPLRGTSLAPLLRDYSQVHSEAGGEQDGARDRGEAGKSDRAGDQFDRYLYSESTFHAAYEPARAVRSGRYKFIRHFSPHGHKLPVNVDDSAAKDFFHRAGYFDEPWCSDELFDLFLDPSEKENRASELRYREVREDLTGALRSWMRETKDPLLDGSIAAPGNAVIDDPDSYSPR